MLPRYAIPDTIEMVKGLGSLSRELNRLRERYPEVFEKELDRLRKLYEVQDTNCVLNLTVVTGTDGRHICSTHFSSHFPFG